MNLNERDKKSIWHPFTHQKDGLANITIVKGEGIYLIDDKGRKYMDAISSWWVNIHGHNNSYINQRIIEQLSKVEHLLFSGFTHEPAILLAEGLLKKLPEDQHKVFYSDNGSTAVEVALKMVIQYWQNRNKVKSTFIALEGAYHGDTFGGMSVGARNVFNNAFEKLLFDVKHIPFPTEENIEAWLELIGRMAQTDQVAGFIFEPLVQGAAGMRMYSAHLLDKLVTRCKELNIFCIADEVMTGFGRTGNFFASDQLENKPDLFCLSKGITAGYLPLGVTTCAKAIYDAFVQDDKTKTFYHGHSYTANPLACTAALAGLELLNKKETQENIERINKQHLQFKNKIKEHAKLRDVRVSGTIIAFELKTSEDTHYLNNASEIISEFFLNKSMIIRPLGNVFYILPPYVIQEEELNMIYLAVEEFLNSKKSSV